ncbi:hypothetical protein CBM2586_B130583 [Cupriavidus phytorum]|uniref:Uncharacterized protein n=1 Tax=Cupriavidus taiwanensis TaxID=164546 RepID=A0A375CJG6_9BURK|nr:hypothetical protein CBM2586_B130583 [Cupriavidus taiwanensis]
MPEYRCPDGSGNETYGISCECCDCSDPWIHRGKE